MNLSVGGSAGGENRRGLCVVNRDHLVKAGELEDLAVVIGQAARERASLRGPMTPLLDVNNAVVENGLVEKALEFVRRNTPVTAVVDNGNANAGQDRNQW